MRNMIIVPTHLGNSPIHGPGVFASECISKGTRVWEFNPLLEIRFSEEEFQRLPPSARREIEMHLYQPEEGGLLYYESTMGKYMNPARDPNVDFSDVGVAVATRDIQAGEQLTCDWRDFMADVPHIDYL